MLVLDVDEVVLEFVRPFIAFLNSRGFDLKTDSFRLHGNVVSLDSGVVTDRDEVSALLDAFFGEQENWQVPVEYSVDTVASLADVTEIVMLTAMPHRYRDARRSLLDSVGFTYPLLTTEAAKGPAIAQLRGKTRRPVAFVDDIPHNLFSVQKSLPDAALIHLMAHEGMRALLPPLHDDIEIADSWRDADRSIRRNFGL